MIKRDAAIAKLEGRVRSLEAIIMGLHEVSPDYLRAVKANLLQKSKGEDQNHESTKEIRTEQLDPYIQAALDELILKADS